MGYGNFTSGLKHKLVISTRNLKAKYEDDTSRLVNVYEDMAETKSLGVHTPVALPYLIAEGILPAEPQHELYSWESYVSKRRQW